MFKGLRIGVGILILSFPLLILAQEEYNPQGFSPEREAPSYKESPQEAFQQMGPMMGTMMRGMMKAMLELFSEPETAEKLATFTKNYYDALIRKGFTPEQALKIVIGQGMPSLGGK
ncbi:MAG: hypothetical protein DRP68_07075 [Candidatus Omnitrophota bacterium]|nr:MAG: hypothetical protein DRP68_07075 [Candidatus Omnitrophota bacterium]RKY45999.1 MAG: hypothetical protein DRP81_02115 [Candidatus Omnitrophota bacterium]HDN86001.1 hypothetical protein [Candidatus Omnitrophota bacterium]